MSNRALIDQPWNVKIELTKGCNLRCKFCPVYSQDQFQGESAFIPLEMVEEIGFQLSLFVPRTRIEFTLRGEPSLHPQAPEVMRILRRHLPEAQLSMFSNGTGWLKDRNLAAELLDAGLNLFNVDCYNNTYARFKKVADAELTARLDIERIDFRDINAYHRIPSGHKRKIVTLVPDLADPAGLVRVRKIHNVGGNLSDEQHTMFGLKQLDAPLEKGCVRPFRELIVHSDGHVVICCVDWKQEDILGHVSDGLENVWYGDTHLAILRALYDHDRNAGICAKCNYFGGYRQGLLRNPHSGDSYRDKPREKAAAK